MTVARISHSFVAVSVPLTGGRTGRKVVSSTLSRWREILSGDRPSCGRQSLLSSMPPSSIALVEFEAIMNTPAALAA